MIRFMSIQRLNVDPLMSQVVVHGATVYLAGQISAAPKEKGLAEQARDIFATIDGLLALAGTDKSRLLSATVYLTDMSTFEEMNGAWRDWISPDSAPARATVSSPRLAGSDYLIEISVIAARP